MIDKDMGSSIGKVLVMFIKGNGVEIEQKDKENINMGMVVIIKDGSEITNRRGRESITIVMEICIRVSSWKTGEKAKG